MTSPFDQIFDRKSSHAIKHTKYADRDVIPMWVADSDFRVMPEIIDALEKRVQHGIFGYTHDWPELNQTVQDWTLAQYDWSIDTDWIVWLPGVVPSFNAACRGFTQPGEAVAVQTPNYPPMLQAGGWHGLETLTVDTLQQDGRWELDMKQLEQHLSRPECKVFLLCNPMNPCGSVLRKDELQPIIDLCRRYDVLLCSDEIHCDLILEPELTHTPAGKLEPDSITLMAASKTFNVAGLSCSFAIIPNRDIRKQFIRATRGIVGDPNLTGLVATEAAYKYGATWRLEQRDYLRANRDLITEHLTQIPGIDANIPEATYLYWLDIRGLGVEDGYSFFLKAGVAPSPGKDFGNRNYIRLNFGCPRSVLEHALERIEQAVRQR